MIASRFAVRLAAVALAVLLAWSPTTTVADESYHSANGFSLTIPDGWVQIPQAEIQTMTSRLLAKGNNNVTQDSGFQPKGTEWFTYPYVLTQVIHYPIDRAPNEREMRQIVQQISGGAANIQNQALSPEAKQLLKNAQAGTPTFDAKKRSFVMPMTLSVPGIGQVKGIAVGHFGKSDLVQVCCYDQAANYANQEANFAKILDSFKFDAAAEYPNSIFGSNPLGAIGAIGIVVLIVAWVVKKARA